MGVLWKIGILAGVAAAVGVILDNKSKPDIDVKVSNRYKEIEKSKSFNMLSDKELELYVPDVYQKSIYHINYDVLKEHGIKFLSFDIDDTITGLENQDIITHEASLPDEAINFFDNLKRDFTVILFSNGTEERVKDVAHKLGIEYIYRAGKPDVEAFRKMQEKFGFKKSEMAHIGNHLVDDARGGNGFGITTCIVRRNGKLTKIPSVLGYTGGKYLRAVLKERDIWRKHHKYEEGDQYYQLGETPKYRYHR